MCVISSIGCTAMEIWGQGMAHFFFHCKFNTAGTKLNSNNCMERIYQPFKEKRKIQS